MNNRLKELRDFLGLSQEEFGSKIGIKSRAHISALESGARNITDRIVCDVCREYEVREEWLRFGKLPMKAVAPTFSLDEFAKQHNATELELNIMRAYFELDPDLRGKLVEHFKSKLTASRSVGKPLVSVDDTEEDLDVEKEVEAYRQELLLEKKAAAKSAASGTSNVKEA